MGIFFSIFWRVLLSLAVMGGVFFGVKKHVGASVSDSQLSKYYALEEREHFSTAKKLYPFITLGAKNTVVLRGAITETVVAETIEQLYEVSSKLSSFHVIYLVLDSPGGSVDAGNRLIDAAQGLPQTVHTIAISAQSMAAHIIQALGERYVIPSADLMLHRITIHFGKGLKVPGELDELTRSVRQLSEMVDKRTAKRLGMSYSAYMRMIYDDRWMNAEQAVKHNWADKIILIRCGKDLLERRDQSTITSSFGGSSVQTFSGCPLLRNPL